MFLLTRFMLQVCYFTEGRSRGELLIIQISHLKNSEENGFRSDSQRGFMLHVTS